MKIRTGFVSNSSTSSFIIKVDKEYFGRLLTLLSTYVDWDSDFKIDLPWCHIESKTRDIEIDCDRDYKYALIHHPMISGLEVEKHLVIENEKND